MPFISSKDQRQATSQVDFQTEYTPESEFGEVFAASVGQVFDEELSISSALNKEGYRDRRRAAEELIDSGALDKDKYFIKSRRGTKFDYNKASLDFEQIKSDDALKEERNAELASRRSYAQDVISRGSGFAQFLGAASAYMLDPVSVATMPIGYATGAAKGLSAIGRSAIKAGAVEMAAEVGIQAFVYDHKHDIDSPYDWKDAITNIATAATAGALLSGGAVGIREYISHARQKAAPFNVADKMAVADESLARIEDTLSSNHLRKEGMTSEELIKADSDYLEGLEMRRLSKPKIDIQPIEPRKIDGNAGLLGQEKSVLAKAGLADDYAQDMLEYKKRFGVVETETPNLKGIVIDEQVKIKETGEIVTVKSDADVMLRRAQKRVSQIQKLKGCIGA